MNDVFGMSGRSTILCMEDEDYRIMFENSVQIASERKIRIKDSGLSFKDMTSEEWDDLDMGTGWGIVQR